MEWTNQKIKCKTYALLLSRQHQECSVIENCDKKIVICARKFGTNEFVNFSIKITKMVEMLAFIL